MPASSGSRGPEVVVAEALPHLLLGAADDAERRELAWRLDGSKKYGGDRQLEDPLLERRRIPLAEPALPELAARLLKGGIQIAPGERGLEPVPRRAPRRRGRHQREPPHPAGVRQRVQQRQQPAPRVAGERQPLEAPMPAERLEVGHLLGPADRHVPWRPASGRRRAGRSRSARGPRRAHRSPGSR